MVSQQNVASAHRRSVERELRGRQSVSLSALGMKTDKCHVSALHTHSLLVKHEPWIDHRLDVERVTAGLCTFKQVISLQSQYQISNQSRSRAQNATNKSPDSIPITDVIIEQEPHNTCFAEA